MQPPTTIERKPGGDLGLRLFQGLIEPSPNVADRSDRRTAQLLSTILLLLAPLALLSGLLQVISGGSTNSVQITLAAAVVMIVLTYLLSRTRHFRVAGALTSLIPTAAGLGVLAANPDDPGWFAFMALSPALATLLVPIRWALILALVNLTGVIVGVVATPALDSVVVVVAIMFNAIVSVILVTAAGFRNRLEQDRSADLLARQQLQDNILAGTFGGIAIVHDGVITEANDALADLFATDSDSLLGADLHQLFDETSHGLLDRIIEQADRLPVEVSAVRRDGSVFDAEVLVRTTTGPSAAAHVLAMRDVTQQKQAAASLLRAQRMESVGRLAAGMAHDTNNELFVISAIAENLKWELKDAGMPTGTVQQVQDATDRISTLIRRVLMIGRHSETKPRLIDTGEFIVESSTMWRQVLGSAVDLQLGKAQGGLVHIDRGRFEQLLLNLVLNARDAIDGAGQVCIEAMPVVLDAARTNGVDLPAGRYQRITISDSGDGIASEHLAHIFEPFFTTKQEGRGTGLGLYTSMEIVRQSGGALVAECDEQGTTFAVYLPEVRRGRS